MEDQGGAAEWWFWEANRGEKKKKQRREVKATEKYKGGAQYLKAGIRNVKLNEQNECKKYISLIFEWRS